MAFKAWGAKRGGARASDGEGTAGMGSPRPEHGAACFGKREGVTPSRAPKSRVGESRLRSPRALPWQGGVRNTRWDPADIPRVGRAPGDVWLGL